MGRNVVETIVGALVLVVAGAFVFYAFAKSDRSGPTATRSPPALAASTG